MIGTVAVGTFLVPSSFIIFHHRSRYDTCRHGDNGVTDKHHTGRKELPKTGDRSDVSVTYSRQGDNCAVNAVWKVVEL